MCRSSTGSNVPVGDTAEAVDHLRQRDPAVTARPDTAQIRRLAFVRLRCPRTPRLDPGPEPNRTLPHLPATQLKHPLHHVLVEPQQVGHRPVAKGRVVLNYCLDRFGGLKYLLSASIYLILYRSFDLIINWLRCLWFGSPRLSGRLSHRARSRGAKIVSTWPVK